MRQAIRSFLSAAIILGMTAGAASPTNVLENPGFESGDLMGWVASWMPPSSVTVLTLENGPSGPGTHCALLNDQGWLCFLFQSSMPGTVVPGIVYYSFDLKVMQETSGGYVAVTIFAKELDGHSVGGPGVLGHYSPSSWATIGGSFAAPESTAYVTIQFDMGGAAVSALVDNVDLHQVPEVSVEAMTWDRVRRLYR